MAQILYKSEKQHIFFKTLLIVLYHRLQLSI